MANIFPTDKKIQVIAALAEGSAMTGILGDTIIRLGVKIGQCCPRLMGKTMRESRLIRACSKRRGKLEAAVGLPVAYYIFVKRHNTLRCMLAMAAGGMSNFWMVGDLIETVV